MQLSDFRNQTSHQTFSFSSGNGKCNPSTQNDFKVAISILLILFNNA